MAKNAIYTVPFRRKRQGKTHYKKRLGLLKSEEIRLVIRQSNTSVLLQFVKYEADGDKVLLTFNSKKLNDFGWGFSKKSLPANYLAGLVAGKKAQEAGIKNAILDMGLKTPISGSKIYAALKGVIDAGVDVPSNDGIFPNEERMSGKHIEEGTAVHDKFTGYKKAKQDVTKITEAFAKAKDKILAK